MSSAPANRRSRLEDGVLKATHRLLRNALAHSSTETLLAARRDDFSLATLARLLNVLAAEVATTHPLAGALARGAARREEILAAAGGALSPQAVADRTGMSRQTVNTWRRQGQLLALPHGQRAHVFPACQFGRRGPLEGLQKVLAATRFRDPWGQLEVLLAPSPELDGQSPIEALRGGKVTEAIAVVGDTGNPFDGVAPPARGSAPIAGKRPRRRPTATAR